IPLDWDGPRYTRGRVGAGGIATESTQTPDRPDPHGDCGDRVVWCLSGETVRTLLGPVRWQPGGPPRWCHWYARSAGDSLCRGARVESTQYEGHVAGIFSRQLFHSFLWITGRT